MSRWRGGLEWTEEGGYARKERIERMADSDLKLKPISKYSDGFVSRVTKPVTASLRLISGTFKARMAQMDGDSKNLSLVYSAYFV
jgi:hypothetical protein